MESSYQVAICECPDINATTMAVDITGRYAMVCGRKCMGLIDLEGNLDGQENQSQSALASSVLNAKTARPTVIRSAPVCKRIVRNSKYEPTASQFNRQIPNLYALSTYQVVEIHSINELIPSKPRIMLRGHSRAIADVEWSHFDPYLLGSSAADCITNLWDIRDSRRPSASLTSVSGATQVRFSKTSSNLIATSHEIDIRIWDIRQPNLPLYYIAAHLQKINGMDWSANQEQLITCGQDNTIKLWDLNVNKVKPSANLQTRTPAWRVRYTPVSPYAILTSALPQLRSRAECMTLKLWSLKSSSYEQKRLELILGLVGHTDVIVDFDWRNKPNSTVDGSCEIVSWSKDQTLRVWRIENQLIEMNVDNSDFETECDAQDQVGQDLMTAGSPLIPVDKAELTSASDELKIAHEANSPGSPLRPKKTSQDDEVSCPEEMESEHLSTTYELRQEFNLINKSIPNIEFEELNYLRRLCLVTARAKSINCRLRIALPPNYPHSECPTFAIIDSNQYGAESLNREAKEKLLNLLNETAKSQLSRSRNCLEPCLRKFIAALQKITSNSSYRKRATGISSADLKDDLITLSAQRDHSVPFPPTSGARFCGNLLVCFGRPMIPTINTPTGGSASWLVETPRSMAQLSAQLDNMRRQGSCNLSSISISYFYYGTMRRVELQNRSSSKATSGGGSRSGSSGGAGIGVGSRYMTGSRGKSALSAQTMISKSYKCGPVIAYDVTTLLGGISKELAENYVFDKDVIKMCRRNAEISASYNRRDLVQIWSLAELSSEGALRSYIPMNKEEGFPLMNQDSDFGDRPWTMHPFGSKLIQSLIDHYVYNCHDVQTAAMLVWTFSSPKLARSRPTLQGSKSITASQATKDVEPASMLLSMLTGNSNQNPSSSSKQQMNANNQISDTISDEWSFVNGPETHLYSNSWSNSTNNEAQLMKLQSSSELRSTATMRTSIRGTDDGSQLSSLGVVGGSERFPKLNILSQERGLQNDLIMHVYAELLYKLNLLNQRAMVLKNIGSNSAYSEIFGDKQSLSDMSEKRLPNLIVKCNNLTCRNKCYSVQCYGCKKYSFYCSICRLPVKGSCSICTKCLHGGHVNHFNTWFHTYDFCPTGCGCKCLINDD